MKIKIIIPYVLSVLSVLSVPVHAADANGKSYFEDIYRTVIKPHEGGFQNKRSDRGNWSSGVIGKGVQAGTNKGISAMCYYADCKKRGWSIRTLTDEQAMFFYRRDFWGDIEVVRSRALAEDLCDEIVNRGPGGGPPMLKAMFAEVEWAEAKEHPGYKVPVPARYCQATFAWLNDYTKIRKNRKIVARAFENYRSKWYLDYVLKHPGARWAALSYWGRSLD